ncbi:hypothetical protein MLD38_012947 [Melastoma candidum]|uniref:Uncharacterized protein n=1 Tax=Melastoma candidum TaxID=119954 RepID=A0ACB9R837_9MYRT|nr:hypothetical protein MLD38_012947 [Melastoma candidum]
MSYEECRKRRVEENKKRMEALNLPQLSQSLVGTPSPKPSPMKKQAKLLTVQKQMVVVRRSSRVANLPAPDYRDVAVEHKSVPRFMAIRRRTYKGRDASGLVSASAEAREYALGKAEELELSLGKLYPTLVRSMLPSHVSGGFWLGLPTHFCKTELPKYDGVMTLVDEAGEEYPTVYLARKNGLSGGWKGFARDHDLADGDAVVFQLTKLSTMKVYIIRSSGFNENKDP